MRGREIRGGLAGAAGGPLVGEAPGGSSLGISEFRFEPEGTVAVFMRVVSRELELPSVRL